MRFKCQKLINIDTLAVYKKEIYLLNHKLTSKSIEYILCDLYNIYFLYLHTQSLSHMYK